MSLSLRILVLEDKRLRDLMDIKILWIQLMILRIIQWDQRDMEERGRSLNQCRRQ